MDSVVIVEDLVVAYGGVRAVDHVSFAVNRGEHLTLLGPSGCGKTTTLRAVAGLEKPLSGRIVIGGQVVFDGAAGINLPPERRGLSMVFQSYAIWPHMTVFDNVAFGLTVRGASAAAKREAVARSLSLVDLASFADRPATALSGGQQQRVALARAVAFDSKVVLLDEPLSNLDARLRASMRSELKQLQRQLGFTSIYVTHDQEEALSLSDRVIIMRAGVIEQQGSPDEIHYAPRTRFAAEFLGTGNILSCTVRSDGAQAGGSIAELESGIRIAARATALADGTRAWLGFRPINVELKKAAGEHAPGWHRATVHSRVFLGDLNHFYLRTGTVDICVHKTTDAIFEEGDEVLWRVPPEKAFMLSD
jgi:iron(III) transport system ATP-binding protein